ARPATVTSPLSLHDALPIYKSLAIIAAIAVIGLLFLVYLAATFESPEGATRTVEIEAPIPRPPEPAPVEPEPQPNLLPVTREPRSEEHTSELQSREKLVCRL